MDFVVTDKRLRCMGHIINLIAKEYLFGQDCTTFEAEYKATGAPERREMWRRRGELGKLHNLVAHVMASGKRTELFLALQTELNTGVAAGKQWKLVLDRGIRWNLLYSMVRRALELREALDTYAAKLNVSKEPLDVETFQQDYLDEDEWHALELIKDQLEILFHFTKALEGNVSLKDGACQASHGALWELLPVFERILNHFEQLEIEAKAGAFNNHPGIQSSITLAWNKTQEYYQKTDASIAWIAALVLHPRFKWAYFEKHWIGSLTSYVKSGKTKLRNLWERDYKQEVPRSEMSPEPTETPSFLEAILNEVAPISLARVTRPSLDASWRS
jgi:hypothetical protein